MSFWYGILANTPLYAWGVVETFVLARALHRRAGLGLADPVVRNRAPQWGICGLTVVAMIALSFGSRLVHGPQGPAWIGALQAGLGVIGAAAIWLGFFPTRGLRARLTTRYASQAHG